MRQVFRHVLELCREAGLIRLGLVALDGTNVKANAALDANRTAATLDEQIARMMAEADAREERRFAEGHDDVVPRALARREDRLARLKACKEKLERRAAEAAGRQQEKIAARAAEERTTGKHPIRPTSPRFRRLRQPEPGRCSTYAPKNLFRQAEPPQGPNDVTLLTRPEMNRKK